MKMRQIMRLRQIIEQMSASLPDSTAVDVPELFPPWQADHAYAVGDRLQYGHILYKVRQAHTSLPNWTPDITPALYEVVTIEDGTRDHPIRFIVGMVLENGKYYMQYDVEYLCIRDSGNPIYNDLRDLINIYVEVVE